MKLCDANNQAKAIDDVFEMTCQYLCREHCNYGIDLHINALQSIDTKQDVNLYIFPAISHLNELILLFEKFMNNDILPPVK